MSQFLSLVYWFNPRPEPLSADQRELLIYIAILGILLGVLITTGAFRLFSSLSQKMQSLAAWFFFSNAFISLAFIFFNYELTPFLRSYFWYPVWAIVAIVWFILLVRAKLISKKRAVQHSSREKEIKKYLPS